MISWLFNLIIPGTGLVFHRREWLGFVLSILFGVFANVAVAGSLIVPEALPAWLIRLSIVLTAVTWASAQLMLGVHLVQVRRRREGLLALLEQAGRALEAGDVEAAQSCLENGFLLDEERIELHVLWARLCAMQGDRTGQEEAWKRVLELDLHSVYREEAMQSLETRA